MTWRIGQSGSDRCDATSCGCGINIICDKTRTRQGLGRSRGDKDRCTLSELLGRDLEIGMRQQVLDVVVASVADASVELGFV